MNNSTNLSSPWVSYYNQLVALFGKDPAISFSLNETDKKITIEVHNDWLKATCLTALLPITKTFGNVTITTEIISDSYDSLSANVYEAVFKGNPLFQKVDIETDFRGFKTPYVIFNREVVQYWDDNIYDINGNISTLAENIARDIFEEPGVHFCTDANIN